MVVLAEPSVRRRWCSMHVPELDLTTVEGLLGAVADFDQRWLKEQGYSEEQKERAPAEAPADGVKIGEFNGTYCGRCGGVRRMTLTAASSRCARLNPRHLARTRRMLEQLARPALHPVALAIGAPPPVLAAECLQCQTTLSLVVD